MLSSARHSSQRFSLLLLEEGDAYVCDWLGTCRLPQESGLPFPGGYPTAQLRGHIRLCVRSLYFDAHDVRFPIVMLPFRSVSSLDMVTEGGNEGGADSRHVKLDSKEAIFMKSNCVDSPYITVKNRLTWLLSLQYSPLLQLFQKVRPLVDIYSLPQLERDSKWEKEIEKLEKSATFDLSRLVDLFENIIIDLPASQITPLIKESGRLVLTQTHLYFQPLHNFHNANPVRKVSLSNVSVVAKRRHMLLPHGIEIFLKDHVQFQNASVSNNAITLGDSSSIYFVFHGEQERNTVISHIVQVVKETVGGDVPSISLFDAETQSLQKITRLWKEKKVSNFDYLLYLNFCCGRSFNDLSQWPVMPWILADYESKTLNLGLDTTFRDLSKPIGALNSSRLSLFKERFKQMEEYTDVPPFLYGTHYSTPGYVLYWLVRTCPAHMLRLQSGKFDSPDRLFCSIKKSWESVLNNSTDLKELIPEFFCLPGNFLYLKEGTNLGICQNGKYVCDVELPPWAKTAKEFIEFHFMALESNYVSENIHHWIDLIFGYKQKGESAIAADNIFHHLTYEGTIDLNSISDPLEKQSIKIQINEFGQTPHQLFGRPHCCRSSFSTEKNSVPSATDKEEPTATEQQTRSQLKPQHQSTHTPAANASAVASATASSSTPAHDHDHGHGYAADAYEGNVFRPRSLEALSAEVIAHLVALCEEV